MARTRFRGNMADGLLAGVCSVATALAFGYPGFASSGPLKTAPGLWIEVRDSPSKCFAKISLRRLLWMLAGLWAGASRRGSQGCDWVHRFAQPCTAFHSQTFRFLLPRKTAGSTLSRRLSREA